MTRLTRREINNKLSQLPVFYASADGLGVYTKDGEGFFFADKNDADIFANSQKVLHKT